MANKPQPNFVFRENYGANYKFLREREKLTQKELAEKLHMVHSTISDIEHSKNPPTIEQLQAYHDFFHVSYEYLLGETDVTQTNLQDICEYTGLSEEAIEWLREYGKRQIVGNVLSELFTSDQFNDVILALFEVSALSNEFKSALDDNGRAKENDGRAVELFRETELKCFNAEKTFRRVIDMFDARSKEVPLDYITGKPKSKPIC